MGVTTKTHPSWSVYSMPREVINKHVSVTRPMICTGAAGLVYECSLYVSSSINLIYCFFFFRRFTASGISNNLQGILYWNPCCFVVYLLMLKQLSTGSPSRICALLSRKSSEVRIYTILYESECVLCSSLSACLLVELLQQKIITWWDLHEYNVSYIEDLASFRDSPHMHWES